MTDIVERLRHLAKLIGFDLTATLNEAADEIERLRKGIQDYLDGNYPHPRSYRVAGANATCPHGRYFYEECGECDSAHFESLISPADRGGD